MMQPHCLINNVRFKRMVLPPGFSTKTSCHAHNPYGGINDYFVLRTGTEPSGTYRLVSLKTYVRNTR